MADGGQGLRTIDIPVRGMTCAGCAARLERAWRADGAIAEATVNFATGSAHVTLQPGAETSAAAAAIQRRRRA